MRIIALAIVALVIQSSAISPSWDHATINDQLEGRGFDQFTVSGSFVVPPATQTRTTPGIVIKCSETKGKPDVYSAFLLIGGIPDIVEVGASTGSHYANVELRPNTMKSPENVRWAISNDHTALVIDTSDKPFLGGTRYKDGVMQLLTGKLGTLAFAKWKDRKSNSIKDAGQLVHDLYVGVLEVGGNKIVMHFDMPQDNSLLADKCGLK